VREVESVPDGSHPPPPSGLFRAAKQAWGTSERDAGGSREAAGYEADAGIGSKEHMQHSSESMSRPSTSDGPAADLPVAGPDCSAGGPDTPCSPGDVDSVCSGGWGLPLTYQTEEGKDNNSYHDKSEHEAAPPPQGAAAPRTTTKLRPTPLRLQGPVGYVVAPKANQWRLLPSIASSHKEPTSTKLDFRARIQGDELDAKEETHTNPGTWAGPGRAGPHRQNESVIPGATQPSELLES
jgi:hypothetical protein